MILNNTAYTHKCILKVCENLEDLTGMKLVTDLNNNFNEIVFMGKYSYMVVNWEKSTCITLSHRLTYAEFKLIQDLFLFLQWLEIGEKFSVIKK